MTEAEKRTEKIVEKEIEEEMRQSYLDYSMSVIVGRALPDVRDGLKPVHRRILYAMYDMGMLSNKPFKKSARIVGEVLGKYHPHGDAAVYETMVRMVQDFSLRYTLIRGQGNFGSIDGDNAAAMRYTEVKLRKEAEEMLQDLDKETVRFVPNFDESLKEPSVLPSKFPNLLVNGSSGIAVGMATNIPPYNLREVCQGIIKVIDEPDVTFEELMTIVKGPDFPTGGIIAGRGGIRSAMSTGKGRVIVRAKTEIIEEKGKQTLIINEIPYQVNKAQLIEQIAELVKDKKVIGISDIRDESDREGMRVVIEIKRDSNAEIVLNQLLKHTRMQVTFGIINLVLVNYQPKVLPLKQLMVEFIDHRRDMVRKRTAFDLDKAAKRAHILEGLLVALLHIDKIIDLIKKSNTVEIATQQLVAEYKLSKEQTSAILEMRLQRLTGLEQNKIKDEHKSLLQTIKHLKEILADENKILVIIKDELTQIEKDYGDERRTEISGMEVENINVEDMIEDEQTVVSITHRGYIKRLPIDTYKQQRRGGRGVKAQSTKEEDFVKDIFVASTHDTIMFFTDTGQVHWLKAYEIPQASRTAMGTAIVNLLNIKDNSKIAASIQITEYTDKQFLMMATKRGTIKKTNLMEYSRPRQGGIKAIILEEGDDLIEVKLTDGNQDIILATQEGMAIRFNEQDARPIGRTSKGVRGINLKGNDQLIGMIHAPKDKTVLTVTENGYGKRTAIDEYRVIGRAGVGVRNIITSDRNGKVVAVLDVYDHDDVIFISKNGIIIRTDCKGISVIGRNTQGVRLMKLDEGDRVVSATRIVNEDVETPESKPKQDKPPTPPPKRERRQEETDEVKDTVGEDDFDFILEQTQEEKNNEKHSEQTPQKSEDKSMFDSVRDLNNMLRKR